MAFQLLPHLIKTFDDSEEWFRRVKDEFDRLEVKDSTKTSYLSALRSRLVKASFNDYHGPGFEEAVKDFVVKYKEEALEWWKDKPVNRYKTWVAATKERVTHARSQPPFRQELSLLPYLPIHFTKLNSYNILPKERVREIERAKVARKRKFEETKLLRIEEPQRLLDQVLLPLQAKNEQPPEKLLPALALASGLRISDIYYGATVDCNKDIYAYEAVVTSFLKPGLATKKTGLIPLLVTFNMFDYHLKQFRSHFPSIRSPTSASGSSRGIKNKEWCLKAIGSLCDNFAKPHHLRALYAKFAYLQFGTRQHEASFVQKVLLHESDYAASAYSNVIISSSGPFVLPFDSDVVQFEFPEEAGLCILSEGATLLSP